MNLTGQAADSADDVVWFKTHCSRMDHGGCALRVGVKDGCIVEIRPDAEGVLNRGYVCSKGLASPEKLDHPDRLKKPLKRTGKRGSGRWKEISWPEALDQIAFEFKRIRHRHGARSVVFCQGMPKGLEHFVLIRLAHAFGSPNIAAVQDVCHAPREVCGLHTCGFFPVVDLRQPSRFILIWGANPAATNEEGAIFSLLRNQLRNGCRYAVIDPFRTELADKADVFLQIRPGTDAALAMAMLQVVISEKRYDEDFVRDWTVGFDDLARRCDEYAPEAVAEYCGVTASRIQSCARMYATLKPSALFWGNAIEHHPESWNTIRALISLMAICGNLDVSGGNVHALEPAITGLGEFVRSDLVPDKIRQMIHAHYGVVPRMMTVPGSYFRKAVLESIPYPVRGAYVQCANPLIGYPQTSMTRQALMALDFLAVSDVFMTPTAALADIVLPAATQFEFDDIGHYGLGHGIILARPRIVDPPAECKSDMWILNEIGKRISPAELWFDDPKEILDAVLKPSGLNYAQFSEAGFLEGKKIERKYRRSGFKTRSKKVELRLDSATQWGLDPLPAAELAHKAGQTSANEPFNLLLTSAKSPHYLHSSYRWIEGLRKREPLPYCRIHPETAASARIAQGERVRIVTSAGSLVQWAEISDRIRPDVVLAASGWWELEDQGDDVSANYNQATAAFPSGKAFGTPKLKAVPCRIEKL